MIVRYINVHLIIIIIIIIIMACYLASVAPHSGDWLLALPIANCGLRLEDEAVRMAVGMRLGVTLCVPHKCHSGSDVDAHGRHAMVCKKAPCRVARHQCSTT